ncbi:MAG: L-threonylcarbamoyladenylate synthase [Bacteroidales bacterium]|nr:L-threonylcarbamoyladenylate synthase [Bacteroidales bacterium]
MLLRINPDNQDDRKIRIVADCLRNGGIIIIPTDTIYGIACDLTKQKAIEKIIKIKGESSKKEKTLSLICNDLSSLSEYTRPISTSIYRVMKRALPGAYTFILNANNNVPKYFQSKRNTVGIRVPDNNIVRWVVETLGNPIVSTSVKDDDEVLEYTTDPELIYEKYGDLVDIVIDGGYGDNTPSTIIDCTNEEPELIREGKGNIDIF